MEQFNNLITFFKNYERVESRDYFRFNKLIDEMYSLGYSLRSKVNLEIDRLHAFELLTDDFYSLKEKVYSDRYQEAERTIEINRDKIIFSVFELMEHNFRENTHSNILRHIFHYRFLDIGPLILSKFIEKVTDDFELSSLILSSTYEIHREYSTNNGRIDLLIEDKRKKYIIVIENKIFAGLSIKEYSEDNTITLTQLDNYSKYILTNYPAYKRYFILLSLYPEDENKISNFIQADYSQLTEVISNFTSDNNIFNEYKLLLNSIIQGQYNKEYLVELVNKFSLKNKIILLNIFEILNKYF